MHRQGPATGSEARSRDFRSKTARSSCRRCHVQVSGLRYRPCRPLPTRSKGTLALVAPPPAAEAARPRVRSRPRLDGGSHQRGLAGRCRQGVEWTAKFIICNAKFLVFDTKFLVFYYKVPCFECKIHHFYSRVLGPAACSPPSLPVQVGKPFAALISARRGSVGDSSRGKIFISTI